MLIILLLLLDLHFYLLLLYLLYPHFWFLLLHFLFDFFIVALLEPALVPFFFFVLNDLWAPCRDGAASGIG